MTRNSTITKTKKPDFHQNDAVGLKDCPGTKASFVEFFLLFFDDNVIETFVTSTNAFAAASEESKWKDIDKVILLQFIRIVIYLGITTVPDRKDVWSRGPLE